MKRRAGRHKYYKHISVCSRWSDFKNFLDDMGVCPKELTIDRIDPQKGYDKANCRWASRQTQNRHLTKPVTNTSGVIGVSWIERDRRWYASISVQHKTKNLGTYLTKEEAIEARKKGEALYWK